MKKNMIIIFAIIIIAIVAILTGYIFMSQVNKENGSKGEKSENNIASDDAPDFVVSPDNRIIKDGKVQMLSLVDTEDEAKNMAKELGIEFKSFSYGVAVFLTKKDPDEVIKEAHKKKLPEISLDSVMELQ